MKKPATVVRRRAAGLNTQEMKDLLVYTADADALSLMRAVLTRPQALGIRPIEFHIDRHTGRDPGMVQSGPELTGMMKDGYHKALLLWDFHGCGREHRMTPQALETEVQGRLNDISWSGRSAATALVPEVEVWLWYCEPALAKHCGVTVDEIASLLRTFAKQQGKALEILKQEQPKELFEHLMIKGLSRTITSRDFEEIGRHASIKGLRKCPSFERIVGILQSWFPP